MWKTAEFWVAISFLVFVALAWKVGAFRKLAAGLDDRAKQIAADLADARRLRQEAEALLAEYQAKRKAAEDEAAAIIEAAKGEAARMAGEAEARLNDFVARRTKAAETKIAQVEVQAQAEVRAAAADAAATAAEQILRSALTGKAGEDFLAKSLKDVRAKLN